uniref:Ig-like domain-containing protein n=1 Tax=Fundulus heteroclitus TaxID=8078 RepID=A0A3Q2TGK0_FUNHE
MWIYIVITLLSEGWCLAQGNTNSNTSVISNSTASPPKVYVNRKAVYNLGSTVELQCSNRTWIKTMFVIWDIELKHKKCRISLSDDGQRGDSCNDGKSIQNNSNGHLFLHIPNFSASDVGAYKCELVYTGGNDNYITEVDVTAPPDVSAWLERRSNKMVAVCRAERGKPAANISWSPAGNDSVTQQQDPDGSVTVESQLEIPEHMDPENLTCIVRHQFWDQEKNLVPKLREGQVSLCWTHEYTKFSFDQVVSGIFISNLLVL